MTTQRHRRTARTSAHAFTVVELLVVVAILMLLIALAIPAIGRARERSRQAICAANQRSVQVATLSYAGDHDGWLMPSYHTTGNSYWPMAWPVIWFDDHAADWALDGRALSCPSAPQWGVAAFSLTSSGWLAGGKGVYYGSIVYMANPEHQPTSPGVASWWKDYAAIAHRASDPGDRIVAADTIMTPHVVRSLPIGSYAANHTIANHGYYRFQTDRASLLGGNVGHLDGSVSWRSGDEYPETLINQPNLPTSPSFIHVNNGVYTESLYW